MEVKLYEQEHFGIVMLCTLIVSFVGLTYLGHLVAGVRNTYAAN